MNRKRRVILLSSNFFPEQSGISRYSTDLADLLSDEGFEVTVVTTRPHYPMGSNFSPVDKDNALSKANANPKVIRLKSYIPKKLDTLGRARFELSIIFHGILNLKKLSRKESDLVISIVPSLSAGLLGVLYSIIFRIPSLAIFQDLSSAAAKEVSKKGFKLLFIPALLVEKLIIWRAKRVIAISEAMTEEILRLKSRRKQRVITIPNYPTTSFETIEKSAARRQVSDFSNDFIVLYSGNFGYKQDLKNVIQAAYRLNDYPEIKIVLMGHGNAEAELKKSASSLTNVRIIPFVEESAYPVNLMAADVLLTTEGKSVRTMSLPSKLTAYYAAGRPVMVVSSSDSATARFVGDSALQVEPGNPATLANAIIKLYQDSEFRSVLERRARDFASRHMKADVSRVSYLHHVEELLKDVD